MERYAFELGLPYGLEHGRGGDHHIVAPELSYGVARNAQVGVELPFAAVSASGVTDRGFAGPEAGCVVQPQHRGTGCRRMAAMGRRHLRQPASPGIPTDRRRDEIYRQLAEFRSDGSNVISREEWQEMGAHMGGIAAMGGPPIGLPPEPGPAPHQHEEADAEPPTPTDVTVVTAPQRPSTQLVGFAALWPRRPLRSELWVGLKILDLAGKAVRNPRRAVLRLVLKSRLARTDLRRDRARILRLVSALWDVDATALLAEYHRSAYARWYQHRLRRLNARLGSARMGTSDNFSCETLYLLVRAARPRLVVETGVLYGASSGHILAALAANGGGELHSIDLGSPPGEPPHDSLVPPDLAVRWHYHEGDARVVLPDLLAGLGRIDMFHHDSLHTFEHMMWEYATAARYLSPDGVLSSHDVLVADGLTGIFRENAFPAFCRRRHLPRFTVRNFGVARSRPVRESSHSDATGTGARGRQAEAAGTT